MSKGIEGAIHGPVSDQAQRVFDMIIPWADQFNRKNQDYTNSGGAVSDNFGIMGQFMKLTDKIHKLRKPMWDVRLRGATEHEDDLNYESADEILDDIIGHAFLAKLYLQEEREKSFKPKLGMNPKITAPAVRPIGGCDQYTDTVKEPGMLSDSRTGYIR